MRVFLAVAWALVLILATGAQAGPAQLSRLESDRHIGAGPDVVRYDHSKEPFADSRFVTIFGWPADLGQPAGVRACSFDPPELTLGPGQTRLSMRQVEMNFATCTTVVEIGVPLASGVDSGDGSWEQEPASVTPSNAGGGKSTSNGTRRLSRALATRSGYYEVIWRGTIFNDDLNKTRANLTWSYNGSCSYGADAWGYWWWRSGTGWHLDDPASYAWLNGGGCGQSYYSHATGNFWNDQVCQYIVRTGASDVRFRGGYAGGYGGDVGTVSSTESCLLLNG